MFFHVTTTYCYLLTTKNLFINDNYDNLDNISTFGRWLRKIKGDKLSP